MSAVSSSAITKLESAMANAIKIRPKVGGFPVLAETLRRAGVRRNTWSLPACQALYEMDSGFVMTTMTPSDNPIVVMQKAIVPPFHKEALVRALRTDQAGQSTFPEFLHATWMAGVTQYSVDFIARTVTYVGVQGDAYVEAYPYVDVSLL